MGIPETRAAYFAGFVDGEGSFSVFRAGGNGRNIVVAMQVGQLDPRPLQMLQAVYGGSLILSPNATAHAVRAKPIWRYMLRGPALTRCIEDLLPYLIVKRERAELALAIRRMMKKGGTRNRYSPAEREAMEAIILKFPKRVRSSP